MSLGGAAAPVAKGSQVVRPDPQNLMRRTSLARGGTAIKVELPIRIGSLLVSFVGSVGQPR
ncbi:hypothetical protein CKO44_23430 [Rubrivivax gelatinosus]|nr:hypothetical protein [Rubrivivax gelatinosus]